MLKSQLTQLEADGWCHYNNWNAREMTSPIYKINAFPQNPTKTMAKISYLSKLCLKKYLKERQLWILLKAFVSQQGTAKYCWLLLIYIIEIEAVLLNKYIITSISKSIMNWTRIVRFKYWRNVCSKRIKTFILDIVINRVKINLFDK